MCEPKHPALIRNFDLLNADDLREIEREISDHMKTLNSDDREKFVSKCKCRLEMIQCQFNQNPTSDKWNNQARYSFHFQQAFFAHKKITRHES